ncbi:MAG: glycosyl transferase family 2 [Gemmatimonadetes bacterium]|nr:glycosyl transferase family 2 [Gemmatimonadota bacterium]
MAKSISVIVRTWNERVRFSATLSALLEQHAETPFEIVCVDSGSSDGTRELAEQAAREASVRIVDLDSTEFTYGRSLNLGAEAASGEILVFLSQDATPSHRGWLSALTAPLDRDRSLCATFGRQIARPHDNPVEVLDYARVFGGEPRRYRSDPVFSNANAALPRARWREIPFDESLPIAEDRLWAEEQQKRGFEIAYVPGASVYHSHDFTLRSLYRRTLTEARAYAVSGRPAPSLREQGAVLRRNLWFHSHALLRDRRFFHHAQVIAYRCTQLIAAWKGAR